MIDVHAVFEGGHGESVGSAGVFAYLPPGVHADLVLRWCVSGGRGERWSGRGDGPGSGAGGTLLGYRRSRLLLL